MKKRKFTYEKVLDQANLLEEYTDKKYPLILGTTFDYDNISNNALEIVDLKDIQLLSMIGGSGSGKSWAISQYVLGIKRLDVNLDIYNSSNSIHYRKLHPKSFSDYHNMIYKLEELLESRYYDKKKKVVIIEDFAYLIDLYSESKEMDRFIKVLSELLINAKILNLTFIIVSQRLNCSNGNYKQATDLLNNYSNYFMVKHVNTDMDLTIFNKEDLFKYRLAINKQPFYYSLKNIQIDNYLSYTTIKDVKNNKVHGLFTPVPLTDEIVCDEDILTEFSRIANEEIK